MVFVRYLWYLCVCACVLYACVPFVACKVDGLFGEISGDNRRRGGKEREEGGEKKKKKNDNNNNIGAKEKQPPLLSSIFACLTFNATRVRDYWAVFWNKPTQLLLFQVSISCVVVRAFCIFISLCLCVFIYLFSCQLSK